MLALLSGLVLIGSTMSTMVAEQTGEIATMRAIGARRRQLVTVYLRTALLLGALGAVVGVPLGVLLANAMVAFFASSFFAHRSGLRRQLRRWWPPARRSPSRGRRSRRCPRFGAASGFPSGRRSPRAARRACRSVRWTAPCCALRFLPRTAQIGLRSVGRRRRRSLATALIVALAVGNLLGIMALASGVTQVTRGEWSDREWQITLGSNLRRPLDGRAERVVRATPGVQDLERVLFNSVELDGRDAFVYGIGARSLLPPPHRRRALAERCGAGRRGACGRRGARHRPRSGHRGR